jgi:hypothetical protein
MGNDASSKSGTQHFTPKFVIAVIFAGVVNTGMISAPHQLNLISLHF